MRLPIGSKVPSYLKRWPLHSLSTETFSLPIVCMYCPTLLLSTHGSTILDMALLATNLFACFIARRRFWYSASSKKTMCNENLEVSSGSPGSGTWRDVMTKLHGSFMNPPSANPCESPWAYSFACAMRRARSSASHTPGVCSSPNCVMASRDPDLLNVQNTINVTNHRANAYVVECLMAYHRYRPTVCAGAGLRGRIRRGMWPAVQCTCFVLRTMLSKSSGHLLPS